VFDPEVGTIGFGRPFRRWLLQEVAGAVVSRQKFLDPPPQLLVVAARGVQERLDLPRVIYRSGRFKDGRFRLGWIGHSQIPVDMVATPAETRRDPARAAGNCCGRLRIPGGWQVAPVAQDPFRRGAGVSPCCVPPPL
jgi:hypothetical protein